MHLMKGFTAMKICTAVGIATFLGLSAAMADDLDDAYAICGRYEIQNHAALARIWPFEYAHCREIVSTKEARDRAVEEKSADMKKTKEVFRNLGK